MEGKSKEKQKVSNEVQHSVLCGKEKQYQSA